MNTTERTLVLLEEYRPAWEIGGAAEPGTVSQIEHGWEIRTENGAWIGVEGNLHYESTARGKDPVCVLLLMDNSRCNAWADDLIMSRRWATEDAV